MSKTESVLKDGEALASQLKSKITIDKDGKCAIADGAFEESLPEGTTVESLKAALKTRANFNDAAAKAFGEKSVEFFKSHKKTDVTRLELEIPTIGSDKVCMTFDKERTYRDPQGGKDIVKKGVLNVRNDESSRTTGSKMNKVRSWVNDLAADSY